LRTVASQMENARHHGRGIKKLHGKITLRETHMYTHVYARARHPPLFSSLSRPFLFFPQKYLNWNNSPGCNQLRHVHALRIISPSPPLLRSWEKEMLREGSRNGTNGDDQSEPRSPSRPIEQATTRPAIRSTRCPDFSPYSVRNREPDTAAVAVKAGLINERMKQAEQLRGRLLWREMDNQQHRDAML